MDQSDPIQNYLAIRKELEQFNEELGRRAELVAVTKAELPGAEEIQKQLHEKTGRQVFLISSVTGQGLADLTRAVVQLLDESKSTETV